MEADARGAAAAPSPWRSEGRSLAAGAPRKGGLSWRGRRLPTVRRRHSARRLARSGAGTRRSAPSPRAPPSALAVNVLVVYTADSAGSTLSLAEALADGAPSSGATTAYID